MKNVIEWTAEPRTNVSQRRADFYRALPDRIETGVLPMPKPPAADPDPKRTRRDRIHALLLRWKASRARRAAALRAEDEWMRKEYPEYPIPDTLSAEANVLLILVLLVFFVFCVRHLA